MRHRHTWLSAIVLAVAVMAASAATQTPAEDAKVNTLAQEFQSQRAEFARRVNAATASDGLALARRESAWAATFSKKLGDIDQTRLSHDAWTVHAIMAHESALSIDAEKYYWYDFTVTPYASPLRAVSARFANLPIQTPAQRLAYLDALHDMAVTISGYEARLRAQMARSIIVPGPELDLAVPFLRAIAADPPSSAFAPPVTKLAELPAEARSTFERQVQTVIAESIAPALDRLAAFMDGPYRAKAPAGVGLAQYDGGREYYQYLIRFYTGLDLTPEAIHEIGMREVTRLDAELDKIRVAAGFRGTLAEFRRYLKTDRRFFPKSSAEIGEAMMAAIRRIEPKVGAFFTRMPKAPYGVLRLDAALEPSMTYGYYQLPNAAEPRGLYRFNGSKPEERSLVMAAATIFHELIPGHHFQLALKAENPDPSPVRRAAFYTPFVEGWAEYSSDLAGEMGMYDDPYDKAGRVAMDLFLSSRLVVDTGMNALGWSRERAMTFMRDYTLESDLQISTETLRYAADRPGQALAYKLGTLKIHEIRDRLTREMGPSFDLARFHGYMLDSGSLPLGVLDRYMNCFAKEQHGKGADKH